MQRRALLKMALGIGFLTLLMLYLQGVLGGSRTAPGRTSPPPFPPAQGQMAQVQEKTIPMIYRWPGVVASHTVAQMAPKVPGRITAITVDVGDAIKKGQVLVRIEASETQARLSSLRAELLGAQAKAKRALADAQRAQNLFRQEALTQERLDAALAEGQAAQAQAEALRHAVAEASASLQENFLRAPFDGHVVERHADPGDMALPGKTVLSLQSAKRLEVQVAIPESCAKSLAPGEALDVDVSGRALQAQVTEIAPAADPWTHTVKVKASLSDEALMPGQFAWVGQKCGTVKVFLVPARAITRVGQLEEVRLVQEGKVHTRLLRTGRAYGEMVEVLSGLEPGDTVLLAGR